MLVALANTRITKSLFAVLRRQGALITGTYNSLPAPTMNFTTGVVTQTPTTSTVEVVRSRFRRWEVDGIVITDSDERAMISKADLPATPTVRDTVTLGSVTYEVALLQGDQNAEAWQLRLRRMGDV